MSVLAWDGKTLAADRRLVSLSLNRTVTKIWRHDDWLMGGVGRFTDCLLMREWVRDGMPPEKYPQFKQHSDDDFREFWLVHKSGTLLKFEDPPVPITYEDRVFAAGSGRDYALAALALGHDALTAVKVACDHDVSCGNGIDTLTFGD